MTHQVKGRTNAPPKARPVNTESNWIVPFMCVRVRGVSAAIETAAYMHSGVASSYRHVIFVREYNAKLVQQLPICQLLHSHPTSGGEYQCLCYLPGCFVCEDFVCVSEITGLERLRSGECRAEKGTRPPQARFISAMGVGFILQYNGIGSTHLMSHIISYVQMGFSRITRYEGIVELMTSSYCILPLP